MKCSVAVHCLIFMHEAKDKAKVTSALLAQSTGCNPVIIRNTLSSLKKAGLIDVKSGTGGAKLAKDPKEISLYDIYHALEPDGLHAVIGIHDCGQRACPVAQNIAYVLEKPYEQIEESIRKTMQSIPLRDLIERFHEKVSLQLVSAKDRHEIAER